MSDLPIVDFTRLALLPPALQAHGAVLLRHPELPPTRHRDLLARAAAPFALPPADLAPLAIAHSPHHRGYSAMHNERDWREQLHFGPEQPAVAAPPAPPWARLLGPNRWPPDPAYRELLLGWLDFATALGRQLLGALAAHLGAAPAQLPLGARPYTLAKVIHYHAQPPGERRRGVAAHLDCSWLTLTLQDDTGGLEVAGPDGRFRPVPPVAGALLVHAGELLDYASRGAFVATPHRVVNPSTERARVSLPVFVNPDLATQLAPLPRAAVPRQPWPEHVHHVLDRESPPATVHFGELEWRRKGRNGWCRVCAPVATGI